MKKFCLLVSGLGALGFLAGCGDLDSAADAQREDELNRAAHVPGFGSDSEPAAQPQTLPQHVPGEW